MWRERDWLLREGRDNFSLTLQKNKNIVKYTLQNKKGSA